MVLPKFLQFVHPQAQNDLPFYYFFRSRSYDFAVFDVVLLLLCHCLMFYSADFFRPTVGDTKYNVASPKILYYSNLFLTVQISFFHSLLGVLGLEVLYLFSVKLYMCVFVYMYIHMYVYICINIHNLSQMKKNCKIHLS